MSPPETFAAVLADLPELAALARALRSQTINPIDRLNIRRLTGMLAVQARAAEAAGRDAS